MNTYSISNVSKILGLSNEIIRHYEREGIIHPVRGENGYRYFSEKDVAILTGIRIYRGMDFPLKEIKDILTVASYENFHDRLQIRKEAMQKELLWKQLVIDSIANLQDEVQRIHESTNLFTFKDCPSVYRLPSRYTKLFYDPEVHTKPNDRWYQYMPVVRISPEFTLEAIRNDLPEYKFGLILPCEYIDTLELNDTQGAEIIPRQSCLSMIIHSQNNERIHPSMLRKGLDYIDEHGYKPIADPWGITIGAFTEQQVQRKFHEIYIPIDRT